MENETDTVDKGWLSGLYWQGRYYDLLKEHQELINKYEELKSEFDNRYRDKAGPLAYLVGGNKKT